MCKTPERNKEREQKTPPAPQKKRKARHTPPASKLHPAKRKLLHVIEKERLHEEMDALSINED